MILTYLICLSDIELYLDLGPPTPLSLVPSHNPDLPQWIYLVHRLSHRRKVHNLIIFRSFPDKHSNRLWVEKPNDVHIVPLCPKLVIPIQSCALQYNIFSGPLLTGCNPSPKFFRYSPNIFLTFLQYVSSIALSSIFLYYFSNIFWNIVYQVHICGAPPPLDSILLQRHLHCPCPYSLHSLEFAPVNCKFLYSFRQQRPWMESIFLGFYF